MIGSQPWGPADATDRIRRIARDDNFTIVLTDHAKAQMELRDLIVGDVRYVLKNGFVYEQPEPSTRPEFFKYKVENRSPNGGARSVRVISIPDESHVWIKVVTVMWVDES